MIVSEKLNKLPSIEDRGQADRVTTPTRVGVELRRGRWPSLWQLMTSQRGIDKWSSSHERS